MLSSCTRSGKETESVVSTRCTSRIQGSYDEFDRNRSLQGICKLGGVGTNAAFPCANGSDGLADTLLACMFGRGTCEMPIAPSDMVLPLCLPFVVSYGAIGTGVGSRTRDPPCDVVPNLILLMGRNVTSRILELQVRELDSLDLI